MVYPFLAVFSRSLGIDLTTLALVLTGRSILGVFGPFMASVADRRGRKTGMLLGMGLFSASMGLVIVHPSLLTFVLAIILSTAGKYIFDPSMQAHLGDRVAYHRRGFAVAMTELSWSLSFILGIPLVGLLISLGGWNTPFLLLGVLGVLAFIVLLLVLPADSTEELPQNTLWQTLRIILLHASSMAGLSVGLFASAANEVVNLVFGVWMESAFGLQIAALGLASAVIGLAELGGEGLVGGLADRLGKIRAIGLGLVANCLAAILLPLLGRSLAGALVGLFLFFITFEFTLVSIIPLMTELQPGARATLMAFNIAGLSLGRAIGDLIGPFLYTGGIALSVSVAVVFNLLALFALRRVGKPDPVVASQKS
jgi:predicted MFS family arabinose efflux permease